MSDDAAPAMLVTLRARLDPAFQAQVFVSLRRYALTNSSAPEEAAEFATLDDAIEQLRSWLEQFATGDG